MAFGYEIISELGRGTMGVVYRARQRGLERDVALKMVAISTDEGASEAYLARFEREALALAKLSHGHLVKVLDAGQHDGHPYIAMELVRGRSLEQMGLEEPVTMRRRSDDLFAQLVSAVAELHRHGLVHRDLKPANVMVDEAGRAVVMDLGLVKDTRGDGVSLTSTGTLIGTPLYLAPEVFGGAVADARADVWSLGCILFFLHAGRPPFAGETFPALIREITAGSLPDLERDLPDLAPERRELLARMLVRAPEARLADAAKVAALLEGRASGSGVRSRPSRPGAARRSTPPAPARRSSARIAIAGALLTCGALAAGFVAWRAPAPRPPPESPAAAAGSPTSPPSARATAAEVPALAELFAKLPELRGFAARLRTGGSTAENARRDLTKRTGIRMFSGGWICLLELDRWLAETDAIGAPPEAPESGVGMIPVSEEIEIPVFEESVRYEERFHTPLGLSLSIEVIARYPKDARAWFYVGRLYELAGQPASANRLYRLGLARLGDGSRRWWPRSFHLLFHALLATGADLEKELPRILGQRSLVTDGSTGWHALVVALADRDPARCERALRAGAAGAGGAHAALALNQLLSYLERPLTERLAWLEESCTRLKDRALCNALAGTYRNSGELDQARRLLGSADQRDELRMKLVEGPPGRPPVPPEKLQSDGGLMWAYATRLAECGDRAGIVALLDGNPKLFGDAGELRFGLLLLGLDLERPELAMHCADNITWRTMAHMDRALYWAGLVWPAPVPAGRARQQAFLAGFVKSHPGAAELVIAQALFASREGRHDAALDLMERALAHPAAHRFSRWHVLEVLVRAAALAPGSPAARRARTRGMPAALRPTHEARLIDGIWSRIAADDRIGAAQLGMETFGETAAVVPGLLPLWVHPASWDKRETWKHLVRRAWRIQGLNTFAEL